MNLQQVVDAGNFTLIEIGSGNNIYTMTGQLQYNKGDYFQQQQSFMQPYTDICVNIEEF